MTKLASLIDDANHLGWVRREGSFPEIIDAIRKAGGVLDPIRRGEPDVAVLQARSQKDAHPRSLSAIVGLGTQPLHTDGAHLRRMPDLVILGTLRPSATPTLLHRPTAPSESQRHGVFRVGSGRSAFYATAVDESGRYRYDPGCMTPADEFAQLAAAEFERAINLTERHEWDRDDDVLVIANRRALHARGAIVDDYSRAVQRAAVVFPGVEHAGP